MGLEPETSLEFFKTKLKWTITHRLPLFSAGLLYLMLKEQFKPKNLHVQWKKLLNLNLVKEWKKYFKMFDDKYMLTEIYPTALRTRF